MNWIEITSDLDLNQLVDNSNRARYGVAIFKHSTRCSISNLVKLRLSASWNFGDQLPIYYLDLLKHRDLSDLIEEKFDIRHESPQLIIIKDGSLIFNASHFEISVKKILKDLEIKN